MENRLIAELKGCAMAAPPLDEHALPDPLRAAEIGTFTHYSVVERLPDIVQRTLNENRFPPAVEERLRALGEGIPHVPIRHIEDRLAPDVLEWRRYVAEYEGQNWLEVPWFFAENYFYRRIMEAIGYFQQGPLQGVDPFEYQKRQGLETTRAEIGRLAADLAGWVAAGAWDRDAFTRLLGISLWGNQADLSLWPADAEAEASEAGAGSREDMIIVDDSEAVAEHIEARRGQAARIDVLGDNAGFELVTDLALVDYILSVGAASAVHLHLKAHPTFVSDAMIKDVHETVEFLLLEGDDAVRAFGERLRGHLADGRLVLHEDFFWNSPLALWALPRLLQDEVNPSHLVISKGDANYRRILGDRHWPFTTPFEDVASYFLPPLLALRTCKSEVVVGLRTGQAANLTQKDPDWLINGEWGLIQFKPRTGRLE